MTGRRGLVIAMAVTALAGGLILLAGGRTWGRAVVTAANGAHVTIAVSGHGAEPALPPLGLVLLVLAGALVAARTWMRRIVGGVVVAVGASVIALGVASREDVASSLSSTAQRTYAVAHTGIGATTSGWAIVTVVAGVLAVAAGATTVIVGRRWPALGARYEPPTTSSRPVDESSAWEALDRGEDPTV